MWAVSDRFAAALEVSHTVSIRVEVWKGGAPVVDSTGATVLLTVTDGSVRVDETSKVRRSLTLSIADTDLMPSQLGDLLSPVDADLAVFYVIQFAEGDTEAVPVGVFRISEPSQSGVLSPVDIAASDYSAVMAGSRFPNPWVTPRGSFIADEIRRMVRDVLPWVDVIDQTGSAVRTAPATWDRERWDAIEDLADSIGAEVFFDVTGTCILRPVPTTAGPDAWTVDHSTPLAVMLDVSQSMSVDNVYNAVIASSSSTDGPPVSAGAYQRSGPLTWRPGVKRPRFYASPLLTTTAQCVVVANALLARSLAYSVQVSPTTFPNPALDAGDVIPVQVAPRPNVSGGRAAVPNPGQPAPAFVRRVLSQFTLPLSVNSASMTMVVRQDADARAGDLA